LVQNVTAGARGARASRAFLHRRSGGGGGTGGRSLRRHSSSWIGAKLASAGSSDRELDADCRGAFHEIHLLGAFSNSETGAELKRLSQLRSRILANAPSDPPKKSASPPRIGDVPKAIREVLSQAGEPKHTTDIHRAVERQLGRPVSYRTVKACLSSETLKDLPRFERISRGEYRLA
jgi:hypothetical protein